MAGGWVGRGPRSAFKSGYDSNDVTFSFGKIRIFLDGTFNTYLSPRVVLIYQLVQCFQT